MTELAQILQQCNIGESAVWAVFMYRLPDLIGMFILLLIVIAVWKGIAGLAKEETKNK